MTDQRRELDAHLQQEKNLLNRVISNLGLAGNGKHFFCPGCQSGADDVPELSIQNGEFYCFKCGTWGDLVGLVKLARNCSLEEAMAWLDDKRSDRTGSQTEH